MANEILVPQIGSIQPQREIGGSAPMPKGVDGGAFDSLLREKLTGEISKSSGTEGAGALKFSAHAMNRIKDRSIALGGDLMQRLAKAVDTAAQKGSKESLILSDDAAFIVSVKNKTVITVVDRNNMNGNVFTNIDSTVVI